MQLVHLDERAGKQAHGASLKISLAIAGLVGCMGTDDFGTSGLGALNAALPLCWWSIYSLHGEQPPRMLATGSYRVPDGTRHAFDSYRQGLYLRDHTFDAARERLAQGGSALTHWRAEEIPALHRDAIYTRHALRERASLVRPADDGGLVAINLYRHQGQSRFDDGELNLLCDLGAALIACVDTHLRSGPRTPAAPDAEPGAGPASLFTLPRREREVCDRILRGWTYEGIAADLGISPGTVKTYRDRAFERLAIHHRNELFALALAYAQGQAKG